MLKLVTKIKEDSQEKRDYSKRIKECDESPKGHLKPDKCKNICNHCYRDLKFKDKSFLFDDPDKILKEREELPVERIPYDAPILHKIRQENEEIKYLMNYINGFNRYKESLK